MSSNDNNSNSTASVSSAAATAAPAPAATAAPAATGPERRVGRVERWLNKGYGFVSDLGRLDTSSSPNTGYAWISDNHSGTPIFIYHSNLQSEQETTFHRLFANEYIEYTADFSLPQHNGRTQGTNVTGIFFSKLLCDLNVRPDQDGHGQSSNNSESEAPRRSRSTNRPRQKVGPNSSANNGNRPQQRNRQRSSDGHPTSVQYIYYVPSGTSVNLAETDAPRDFVQGLQFPPLPQQHSEPNYVMPTNGIPVPK